MIAVFAVNAAAERSRAVIAGDDIKGGAAAAHVDIVAAIAVRVAVKNDFVIVGNEC